MPTFSKLVSFAILISLLAATVPTAAAAPGDDAWIEGYAVAVAEREFGLPASSISVEGGTVLVAPDALAGSSGARLRAILATIPGVVSVVARTPPNGGALAEEVGTIPPARTVEAEPVQILPRARLFEPLLGDPRWPRFQASYRYHVDDPDVTHAGAVGFGETFTLYRDEVFGGRWDLGFQAGVFAVFDLDSESADLVNADYLVGIPVSWRKGPLSALARIYHQSSHLGDEYLLRRERNADERVNLSYEAVDLKLSYDIGPAWRVYGGAGYLFHREPSNLAPWTLQAGVEWESGDTLAGGALRPVAALDLQATEEAEWDPDWSLRAGVQLQNPRLLGRSVQIMGEYYNGRNPNGQFYTRDLEYLGLGIQVDLN